MPKSKRLLPPPLTVGTLLTLIVACSVIAVWVSPHSASSTDPPQTIQSDSPFVLQTGTWTAVNTPNASGGSYLYASSPSDTLSLDFYGTSIDIYYVTHATFGSFAIEIDNNIRRTVVTTSKETTFGNIAAINYLDDTPHTLRIYSVEGVIAIDAFYAIAAQLDKPDNTEELDRLPLAILPNEGQFHPDVRFRTTGLEGTAFFTDNEVVYVLPDPNLAPLVAEALLQPAPMTSEDWQVIYEQVAPPTIVRVQFEGINSTTTLTGNDLQDYPTHFFVGDDPSQWATDVPTYGSVVYEDLYTGVDLRYDNQSGSMQGTYIIEPGADVSQIRWRYDGVTNVQRDTATGQVTMDVEPSASQSRSATQPSQTQMIDAPLAWQEDNRGQRMVTAVDYVVAEDGSLSFSLEAYDEALPLTLAAPNSTVTMMTEEDDPLPEVVYNTYLGGSGMESGGGIIVDGDGNAIVVGTTYSTDFPTENAADPSCDITWSCHDVFITKLNDDGSAFIFSTYLGGEVSDYGYGISLDSANNIYITGETSSTNFPTPNGKYTTITGAYADAFIAKLSADGSSLLYGTFLGGSQGDSGVDIEVDNSGVVYVVGYTQSYDFPVTEGAFQTTHTTGGDAGFEDTFITKLNISTNVFGYSTYFGGAGGEYPSAMALDDQGNVYFTGSVLDWTAGVGFPLEKPLSGVLAFGPPFGYAAKLNASGSALHYSTAVVRGGYGRGIAIDENGTAYLTGSLSGTVTFPVTTATAYQSTQSSGNDAYLLRLSYDETQLTVDYATYLGGTGSDIGGGVDYVGQGQVVVVGVTASTDFPTKNPIQGENAGSNDVFFALIDTTQTGEDSLGYSTYLGGSASDSGGDIFVDAEAHPYMTGITLSADFPVMPGAVQETYGGMMDVWVAKDPVAPAGGCFIPYKDNVETMSPPFRSQEATDMLTLAFDQGLYFHAAPTINAPIVEVVTTTSTLNHLPWNEQVHVAARLAFNSSGEILDQDATNAWIVWYGLSNYTYDFDSGGDGTNELEDQMVWVVARMGDYIYYEYDVNADDEEPCVDTPTPTSITIPYNRAAAALYGLAQSYQNSSLHRNDLIILNGSVEIAARSTKRLLNLNSSISIPFANFVYHIDQLSHETGKSASAIFVSEGIWIGGMPMTTDDLIGSNGRPCAGTSQINDAGWRYCDDIDSNTASGMPLASFGWKNHDYLVTHFTTGSANTTGDNDILGADRGYNVDPVITSVYLRDNFVSCLSCGGNGGPQARWNPTELSNYFLTILTDPFSPQEIEAGDYLWIDTGAASHTASNLPEPAINHGLAIIGWGPIGPHTYNSVTQELAPAIGTALPANAIDIGCPQVLDCDGCDFATHGFDEINFTIEGQPTVFTTSNPNSITVDLLTSRPNDPSLVLVPYVVDFLGTLDGRTQRPVPRPFFCTRFNDVNGAVGPGFNPHDWFFYHFPSDITLDVSGTYNPIYVPFNWVWTSSDGY